MGLAENFWRHAQRSEGCWEWVGARGSDGYGHLIIAHKSRRAHRIAWELTNGPIPAGIDVLHHCDNPPCVRPDHLWLGTRGDNNRDRAAKGRTVSVFKTRPELFRGESHSRTKFRAVEVTEIRRLVSAGEATRADLARKYGVTHSTIRKIVNGTTWVGIP